MHMSSAQAADTDATHQMGWSFSITFWRGMEKTMIGQTKTYTDLETCMDAASSYVRGHISDKANTIDQFTIDYFYQ